jgi:hypothetical protein
MALRIRHGRKRYGIEPIKRLILPATIWSETWFSPSVDDSRNAIAGWKRQEMAASPSLPPRRAQYRALSTKHAVPGARCEGESRSVNQAAVNGWSRGVNKTFLSIAGASEMCYVIYRGQVDYRFRFVWWSSAIRGPACDEPV